LIARAERLFEERLGEERATVGHALAVFVATLDRQIPDAVREARQSLSELLDSMDRSFFL
jgi:molecular chaperone HscC